MEIALESPMPTYSGGLGVLAGDTLRSGADLDLRTVAGPPLLPRGAFAQERVAERRRIERAVEWSIEACAAPREARVSIPIEGRRVQIRAWRYAIRGARG